MISLQVNSKEEAMSENFHAQCCDPNVPICIVRGLSDVLELDLDLFSSDSLVKTCGEQEIEVRIQVSLRATININLSRQFWHNWVDCYGYLFKD